MATVACSCTRAALIAPERWRQTFSTPKQQTLATSWRGPVICRGAVGEDLEGSSVVVTRERGKNAKLVKALSAWGIRCVELPLIEHREGPDLPRLAQVLQEEVFDWIVVTSPEAATVFLNSWESAGCPTVRIAVVGAGTGQVLQSGKGSLPVEFTPSTATAKVLAAELPEVTNGRAKVLYPASCKAGVDLENGLSVRGFNVTRLNTYSTESATTLAEADVDLAVSAPVATFASPTAVKAWMELVAGTREWSGAAACIGSTSAVAARKAGLQKVFYPQQPGLEGWVDSILEALRSQRQETIA